MSERKRLKETIANTLKNSSVRKNGMSYEDWLMRNGYDSESLAEQELAARMSAERSLGEYGASAERLAAVGTDGYADYITRTAKEKEASVLAGAQRQRTLGSTAQLSGYADYIQGVSDSMQRKRDALTDKIMSANKIDSESIYKLAIGYGLSEQDARAIERQARTVKTSGNAEVRSEILEKIIHEGMDEERAYRYALACGISEGDADKMAQVASYYKRRIDYTNNDLYEQSLETQKLGVFDIIKKIMRQNDKIY